ncbi:hypothetical protein FRACYDRAFT_251191 [Fragilariopsis cylindrus CCMP1102]|uniref:Uncharacterized protein n=1 Tax=Fragilariopsis cylindrus CCMP1102 TaxID=635003 RepID=A0A1E7ENE9_9STRA|nr:hypothetical protein FRACYDRAFT_251191 [Fragilariopsis cylindrus CCMP1102]|eukprot:OEU07385.1 hypothetical protein FRACYDRAFT_251191 [Fragilariopsis cylindrus CCMP1102]
MELRQGFAGGCQVNGTGICVTKPETYCDADTFWPAHYLRTPGNPLRYCTYSGIIENVIIGRCSSVGKNGNGGKCSNLQSRCDSIDCVDGDDCARNGNLNGTTNEEEDDQSSLSIEYDPTCTITQDLSSSSTSYVTYGRCDDRCVWSSEDCMKDEIYIPNDQSCTADKVQIGACFAGHAYCAVDAASCTTTQTNLNLPEEPVWTHQEVKEKLGVTCFLASLPTPPTESPPPPPPTESPMLAVPTSGFAVFDEDGNPILVSSSNKNGGDGGLQTGALVAIVAVVAVVIGAVIGVGTVRLRNKRKDQHANNNAWKVNSTKQHTLPIEDIEIKNSNENMDNDNNNNDDDDDANSELSEENYHQIIMQQQK